MWWLPEVHRMRAILDSDRRGALVQLSAAAELAAAHGSVALVRRCERSVAVRGGDLPDLSVHSAAGVRPPP
jgi:hypothetical protein